MWNLHAALSLVILGCIEAEQRQRGSPMPNFTKHLNYGSNDFVLTYSIGDAISFAHATCRRRNEYDSYKGSARVHKKCRLVLETTVSSGKSFAQTCEIRLYPKWTGGSVARQFKLVRFGVERLVLVWRESIDDNPKRRHRRYMPYPLTFNYHRDHLRVKVVRMKDCQSRESQELQLVSEQRDRTYEAKICASSEECETARNETEIFPEDEGTIHNVNVLVNGDESFDVYFRNAYVCGRERRCRVSYDSQTESFDSTTVAPLEVKYDSTVEIYPIVSEGQSSNILAYALRTLYLDDGAVTLLSSEGRTIYEHTYSWSPYNLPRGISNMAMSTLQETLGFCQQPTAEAQIQCSLFDAKGRGLIGVDVALKSADVALIEMRNTFDAGFLLLIGYGNATTSNGLEALDILRVNSRGELANLHTAKSHRCSRDESGVDVGLIEKSPMQVCYYMACTWPMPKVNVEETHWQLFGECFTEAPEPSHR